MAKNPQPKLATEMRREVATIGTDPFTFTYGGRLSHMDDTLASRGGGKGIKVYDDIERDTHAYAVLQKRKHAVVACEWDVNPATESPTDKLAAEVTKAALKALPFDQICLDLLDAILKGYAVSEVIWTYRDGRIVPKAIKARDQRRFVFNDQNENPDAPKPDEVDGYDPALELRMLTRSKPYDGEAVPQRKFIVNKFGSKDGNPYGLGLGSKLFWPILFKRKSLTFWLIYNDKFSAPTAVGKYPPGTVEADQRKLLDALQAIATDAGVVIPEDLAIELLEAKRSGSFDTYEKFCRYLDEQISECVLGETLTTNIGSTGSKAAADTHNGVRRELTKADADLLANALNETLVKWIAWFNVPDARPPSLWWNTAESEDENKLAERDTKIAGLGFEPSEQYIQDTYGPHWTKKRSLAALKPGQIPPAGDPASFAAPGNEPVARQYATRAVPDMQTIVGEWVRHIGELIDQGGSIDEIRERVLKAYPDIPIASFAQLMEDGLTAAHLAGRYEASLPADEE